MRFWWGVRFEKVAPKNELFSQQGEFIILDLLLPVRKILTKESKIVLFASWSLFCILSKYLIFLQFG